MPLIQSCDYYDATATLLLADATNWDPFQPAVPAVRVLSTFAEYPYDEVPRSDPLWYPTHLDHIFIRDSSGKFKHAAPLCHDDGGVLEFEGKRYGASDHKAISITLTIKNE